MTNKLATVQVSASYSDPDGQRAAIARVIVDAPYQEQTHTEVAIPDGTAADVAFDIDFGSVAEGATLVIVRNLTANVGELYAGQDLWLKLNSANISSHKHYLPVGGFIAIGMPANPGTFPLLGMSVTTTDAGTQQGIGKVVAHVFGDPEAP